MDTQQVTLLVAFGAGFLSFVSPCVLPLVPVYIAFLGGEAAVLLDEEEQRKHRWKIFFHSLLFVLGFSTIFVLMGLSASAIGDLLRSYQDVILKVGGIFLVIMGISMMGLLKTPLAYFEKKLHYNPRGNITGINAFLVGMVFAVGWTPCVGPILGSILLLASTQEGVAKGALLLASYSAGLGIPFLAAGLALNLFRDQIKKLNKYMNWISIISGVLLIVMGILLFTNNFQKLSALFNFSTLFNLH